MKDLTKSATRWHQKAMATKLDERSKALRRQVVKMLEYYQKGHVGPTLSLIEILRVLYDEIMKYDPGDPDWSERDRCILSKGHGCMAQYVLLADKGFFDKKELKTFCRYEAMLGGHPDSNKIPGVETSTGSLGHGLSVGTGMAMALRLSGKPRISKIFVILGDGECDEGSVWEACMSAGNHGLDNLTIIIDYNKYQAYDAVHAIQNLEPLSDKLTSFGLSVKEVNGHDVGAIRETLKSVPFAPGRPSGIICHTVKGKGIPDAENNLDWHYKSDISVTNIQQLYDILR